MEQNKEMTAQESLKLISETLNNSRRDILRKNAKYYVLWGCLLTVFSLLVYFLWHFTGKASWNFLWFVMPVVGLPLAALLHKKDTVVPQSFVGNLTGKIWGVFAAFALTLSALAVLIAPMPVTLVIVILLGMAETFTGVVLKNWPIIIGGFIFGVVGAVAATMLQTEAQMLLFTLGGVILAITGVIIKLQNK